MKWYARKEVVPATLVLFAFVGGGIASPYFWDFRYLLNESSLYVEGGLLALGMTLVIIAGQIDLSVASTLALVAVVNAKLLSHGYSISFAIPVSMALGALLGWINGLLISRLGLPSFVVTLATMAAYRGIAQVILGAGSEKMPPSLVGIDMKYFPGTPIPVPILIFLLGAVATGLVLHRTVFGRLVYAVGTNERAAFFSGVSTGRITTLVFVSSGMFAAVAGILIDSRLGVARYDHAQGLELDVITAVVLGGASISGGKGSVVGTVLALALIGLIRTGMGVANVTAEYQLAAIGTLLVVSILLAQVVERATKRDRTNRTSLSV